MIWIGYTTLYREGGPKFARAAATLARAKRKASSDQNVRCERIESKRDFVDAMARIAAEGATLDELHFIGHSGMYGPMFRTSAMPEQFSPHEWRQLTLPWAHGAAAYFHACRTARWFAPFFARTFSARAYGYHGYTTVSTKQHTFAWDGPLTSDDAPLYVIACPGRKSHGLPGALLKHAGLAAVEKMSRFDPAAPDGDTSYDGVAALYDAAFADIGVRVDEVRWLEAHLPSDGPRVLDLGCGNGALLERFAGRIASGVGIDRSSNMVARAQQRNRSHPHLSFATVDGPELPIADASIDVVVSLLSFRYLDWDPMMNEMRRVLAPGGRILIVDMVTAPLESADVPLFVRSGLRELANRRRYPAFRRAVAELVADPRWQTMLAYNPIRAQHEYVWYLESRFPGRRVEVINVGWTARVLAFDSGPLAPGWVAPQSYP